MRSHLVRDERGFTMVVMMVVLLAGSLLVGGALAAAEGDLPFSGDTRDRKIAYASAESGLNLYQSRLNADNEYWTKCDDVPAPNGVEMNPVNQEWRTGADLRRWRNVPESTGRYTLELLPAPGKAACVKGDNLSMIDTETSTFRVRATGEARENSRVRRSLVATFRRASFLDFIYFTEFETLDPLAYAPGAALTPAQAQAQCAKVRSLRDSKCAEIRFITGDFIKGPFRTNDDVLICGSPVFGRTKKDRIEIKGPGAGSATAGYHAAPSCTASPTWTGSRIPSKDLKDIVMPKTNTELVQVAKDGGYYLQGRTTLRLKGNTVDITNHTTGVTENRALPGNGVIYVDNGLCAASLQPPILADYKEPKECAVAYVSGTYNQSLTIASKTDIVIDGDVTRSGDPVLGLIADNNVRVKHEVDRNFSGSSFERCKEITPVGNRRIDAAILSLTHSFTVDNYACGDRKGDLIVNGAIAQQFRGPVGTSGGPDGDTGYLKAYEYDDRLRYRSPPHFVAPVAAAWGVVKVNEQVPAR
jgi:hypothetical protein